MAISKKHLLSKTDGYVGTSLPETPIMSNDQNRNMSDSSEKVNLSNKAKVNCYTQVDSEVDGPDIRRIVGQEDNIECALSKRLLDLSLRKQNKGIRPPLVGQASSSSNDSVSLSVGRASDTEPDEHNSPPFLQGLSDSYMDVHVDVGLSDKQFNRSNFSSTPYLLNRDDYINQRPPEGSSDQIGTINQPIDNVNDFPRIRTPSSASSVTSSRPLEWDSGADVGYNQVFVGTGKTLDPGMSTIERMALACRTNLLTRSDPEGTTGPSGQAQPVIARSVQSNFRTRNKLGCPNAESTPLATCTTSDASPETVSEGIISPIPCENKNPTSAVDNTSGLEVDLHEESKFIDKDCIGTQHLASLSSQKNNRSKIPLFPEIINSLEETCKPNQECDLKVEGNNQQQMSNLEDKTNENNTLINQREVKDSDKSPCFNIQLKQKLGQLQLEKETYAASSNKKLSSSLENVSTFDNVTSDNKSHSNTIPRSQSQLNLHFEKDHEEIKSPNNIPKYSMALHNLIQYNKSASSSSIATVVHRKGDSPKHVFAQTSVLKQESVGIQVCDGNDVNSTHFSEIKFHNTPHLPKPAGLAFGQFPIRSNYFDFDSSIDQERPVIPKSTQLVKPGNLNKNKCNGLMFHSHDGVPCTGAHRRTSSVAKNVKEYQESKNKQKFNPLSDNYHPHAEDSNRPTPQGSSNCINDNKLLLDTGTRTIDSVESSAKSGGCYTDKQYSVTVEDRVNSFEYLPGHVYENTERQAVDSRGTSSISIQNQTSNNETPDDQGTCKTWDSSVSGSSTLEKDVRRGVEMISDFVKGSCANDSVLKKKLIRRVVEKLITKNYNDDKIESMDLTSNVPWVPSRPPNPIDRNGRETRRSVNRSKVPCEFSSRSEKSGSTNASSECFIPRPAANSTFLPSSLRENPGVAGQGSHSSTSEISIEKSSKNHGKPPQAFDVKTQIIQNGSVSKDSSDSSSKATRSTNWKDPTTKIEKLYEERRKLQSTDQSSSEQSDAMTLVQYLNMERENQLFWIRSEIQHLSNLKELLEKQEELKKGIKILKSKHSRAEGQTVLKDKNQDRVDANKGDSGSSHSSEVKRKSSLKTQSKYRPTLSAWLENSVGDTKASAPISTAASSEVDMEDWTSHHYKNENTENIRSCMKRKFKHQTKKVEKHKLSDEQRDQALYDEPPLCSFRGGREEVKQRKPSTPYRPRNSNQVDESVFITDEGLTKKNAQTETLDTVGVQTSNSVQQLPVVHPNWFKRKTTQPKCQCACQSGCRCCGEKRNNPESNKEEKTKAPVGYYITFEPSPRERDKHKFGQRPLEEVRIQIPMSEPKQRPTRRLKLETDRLKSSSDKGESEIVREDGNSKERERERARPIESVIGHERLRAGGNVDRERQKVGNDRETEVQSMSSQSENGSDERIPSGRPIFQGTTGLLQFYLLRNRPSYVSRAEDRRQCIAQMQYLRELRDHSKRRLLSLTEPAVSTQLPPPPLAVRRVFSQQTMRRQTERKYRQLAEVRGHQQDTKRKEGYRTNRLMAQIFNKKLQKRVLKGEVNLSNSVSVISNL